MQLFIVIALLLYASKTGGLNGVKPLVDTLGDEQLKKAYDDARKLSAVAGEIDTVMTAVRKFSEGGDADPLATVVNAFAAGAGENPTGEREGGGANKRSQGFRGGQSVGEAESDVPPRGFGQSEGAGGQSGPLAPIATVADDGVLTALSRYIAVGD